MCEDFKNTHVWRIHILSTDLSEEDAFSLEKLLIKHYRNSKNHRLSNVRDGGEGGSGLIHSEETKKLFSKMSKEMWEDEEFRERMIKLRNSEDSPYKTKEFREKLSSITKGEKNGNYGNYWSDEQKKSLSEKRKGVYSGDKNPRATKIMCVETGETFNTIKEATEKIGLRSQASLTIALNNPNRTAKGHHWVRVESD